jgi:hypothetical protein
VANARIIHGGVHKEKSSRLERRYREDRRKQRHIHTQEVLTLKTVNRDCTTILVSLPIVVNAVLMANDAVSFIVFH